MNTARIVVLTIALGAGGVAAYLASGTDNKPRLPHRSRSCRRSTFWWRRPTSVSASRSSPTTCNGRPGRRRRPATPSFAAANAPTPTTRSAGSIARAPFIAGEPIREQKLVRADGSGFMAAILPTGMRAISTEISPETGAGGFILPNDRVDVILSKREKGNDRTGPDIVNSEIILTNVRVLAIDQAPKEKDGQNAVVGKTVTLELKPEQAETLARARQSGTLALALRSIADLNMVENNSDESAAAQKVATASTSFATASKARRRHRSDRRTPGYEVQLEISWRCGLRGPRNVAVRLRPR